MWENSPKTAVNLFSDIDPNRVPPQNKSKCTECGTQRSILQLSVQKLPLPKQPGRGRQLYRDLTDELFCNQARRMVYHIKHTRESGTG